MNRSIAIILFLAVQSARATTTEDEPLFPTKFEWGQIVTTASAVELHVESVPNDQVVRIPRFNNPYRRIFLKSDPKKNQLKFRPEVSEWLVTVPLSAATPTTIMIETAGAPQLLTQPFVTKADRNGAFVLPAHHAVVHGKLLRYEPQPHKNTVGYWANEKDWCEWHMDVEAPGQYKVHILQGCGKGHGGSEVKMILGRRELTFLVEDTGHFQNFKTRVVGTLEIKNSGRHLLKVVPVSKAKGAVMDVRQIQLVPAGS